MKMPKVDNFLGCMKLETGGLVIGWLGAIGDVILFIAGIGLLVFLCQYDCDDLSKALKDEGDVGLDDEQSFICSYGRGIFIGVSAFFVVMSIGLFVIAFLCIRGTHRRNHIYVKPMVVLLGVSTVLAFLQIFSMNTRSIGSGIVQCLISGYEFVVMYSLYCVFEEEYTRGRTVQYYPPVAQYCPPAAQYYPPGEKAYPPGEKAYPPVETVYPPLEKV